MPWLGYFHKMKKANMFIILDNVQLPGKGLPNRNYIKGKDGKKVLLTVPLKRTRGVNSTYLDSIPDYSKPWQKDHLNKIKDAYVKAPFFEARFSQIETIILKPYDNLSQLSLAFIEAVCVLLEINTKIVLASNLNDHQLQKNERNIDLCLQLGANTYLSGQGAKRYNDANLFAQHQLNIIYQSFESPVYKQLGNDFIPNLSVADMLFNLPLDEIIKKIKT
jgi:hypothetical protein